VYFIHQTHVHKKPTFGGGTEIIDYVLFIFYAVSIGSISLERELHSLENHESFQDMTEGYGLRLVLHEIGSFPLPSEEGMTISGGYETSLALGSQILILVSLMLRYINVFLFYINSVFGSVEMMIVLLYRTL
jgi:hypothetical protein